MLLLRFRTLSFNKYLIENVYFVPGSAKITLVDDYCLVSTQRDSTNIRLEQ